MRTAGGERYSVSILRVHRIVGAGFASSFLLGRAAMLASVVSAGTFGSNSRYGDPLGEENQTSKNR